jgi:hypothetical protein
MMSFDVFVQCYGETAKSGLPRERILSMFPISKQDSDRECWVVKYDELNSSDIYVDAESPGIKHFMVSHPAEDIRFWGALLAILQMGSVVMFWPGSPPLVAHKSDLEPLPEEMIEALGEPISIERPEQIFELLKLT